MRNSKTRDSIIYSSAMALIASGIAVIVIGTWLTAPEDLEPKETAVVPESLRPLPQRTAEIGRSAPMDDTGERRMYPSNLVNLPVYSVDGESLGEVAMVGVAQDGEVRHIYLEVPEFLGLGTKTVRIPIGMAERKEDRVELELTADAVKLMPDAE